MAKKFEYYQLDIPNGRCQCARCGELKPLNQFKRSVGTRRIGLYPYCQKCDREYQTEWRHRTGKSKPLSEAKTCPSYLGVHIAERVLLNFFDNVTKMPYGNPGYDFVCGKGFKIDVKSACRIRNSRSPRWAFEIKKNDVPDFFLCLAFDDLTSLNPEHLFLVPRDAVKGKRVLSISNKSMENWKPFEKSLDRVLSQCGAIRNDQAIADLDARGYVT